MISHLDIGDFVPLPWPALFHQDNSTFTFERTLIERRNEYATVDRLVTAPNLLPLAQITLQRVTPPFQFHFTNLLQISI